MKRYLLVLFIWLAEMNKVIAQEPTAAPAVNPFSLQPENLGTVANSVNLFTGDLNLPFNLVSIPGGNSLGIDLSISYSSANIENISGTWNLESPTGVLGLGWSLAYPMIVADNKLSGSREDDEFYLIEGGISTRLICIGNSSGTKSYKTKTYSNWILTYTSSTERWEITKEDGTKYIYGDLNSSRNTVQWIVKWNNWIGNSNIYNSQRQGFAWNLSEVKNVWGEKITYTYLNDENFVGAGSTNHTEASYLYKINDSWGNEVELKYNYKLSSEFQDPHTEMPEPDAYQERYEKRFLDKVIVRTDGIAYYEVQCKYVTDLLGSGNLTKRLLKSITQISSSGSQSPSTSFDYLTSGPMKGALSSIANGTGGSVSFDYEDENGLTIEYSDRYKALPAPSGFAEPTVVMSDDFMVTVWRGWDGTNHDINQRPIRVITETWDGGWKEEDLGNVASVKLLNATNVIPDYIIRAGQNCFAILVPTYSGNNHSLYLWYKDEAKPGKWRSGVVHNLVIDDPTKKNVIIGDRYVAVVGNNALIYTFNFTGVLWTSSSISFTSGNRYYDGALNFLWAHNTTPSPDAVTFYYLDEARNWINTPTTFSTSFNAGSGSSNWYSSNTNVLGMIPGGPDYLFTWNENYTSFSPFNASTYADNSFIKMYNGVVHITDGTNKKQQVYNFNGSTWIPYGDETLRTTSYTYNGLPLPVLNLSRGDESFAWTKTGVSGQAFLRRFDRNTSQWLPELSFPSSNGITPDMGVNYFRIHSDIYFRNPNGTTPSLIGSLTPAFQGFESRFGYNYIIYRPVALTLDTYVQYFRNGQLYNPPSRLIFMSYHLKGSWLGNNAFVVAGMDGLPQDKTTLYLYRSANLNYTGKIKDYPVIKVTTNDGNGGTRHTSYLYDATKATYDPSNTFARYNKVSTFPGSATSAAKPFGYTETYFFNGLSEAELGSVFPKDGGMGNVFHYYKIVTGQPYQVKVFSSTSTTPIAETKTLWNVDFAQVNNSASTPVALDIAFTARPYQITQLKNGIETQTIYNYGATKQLTLQRDITYLAGGYREIVETEFVYANEWYTSCATKNILSPVVQTKKKINNSIYTESSVTRWKDWPCTGPNCIYSTVPSPVDQYAWKGTNGHSFTWSDVAQTPSSDWLFLGKSISKDNSYGMEVESQGLGNQLSCLLLNQNKRNVVATVSNAPLSKIAYSSFESTETTSSGNWTSGDPTPPTTGDAKTGDRFLSLSSTGLSKSGLVSTDRYTLSFWAKPTNGFVEITGVGVVNLGTQPKWTLFEFTITNITSFNIKKTSGNVDIDEVRFHPLMARMTTQTHHPLFGATSSTSTNNQTIYTEYDDLGRVKNRRDQRKDIVQTYQYNYKK